MLIKKYENNIKINTKMLFFIIPEIFGYFLIFYYNNKKELWKY